MTQFSTCQKLQAYFISIVNPRLSNFSTPLLLALLVEIGTVAITGGFFAYTLSAELEPVLCTSTSEKIQVQGNIFQQQDFILRTKKKSTLFMIPNEKYPEFSHYPLSRYPRAPGDTFTTNDLLPKGVVGENVKGENGPLDGIRVLDRDNVDWRERQLKNKDSPERDLMSDGQTSVAALATAASGWKNEREQLWKGCLLERCETSGVEAPVGITDGGCCYSQCGLNPSLTEMEPLASLWRLQNSVPIDHSSSFNQIKRD